MEDVFRLMESAAASFITVLIEGETGTGKELVARLPSPGDEPAAPLRFDQPDGELAAFGRNDMDCPPASQFRLRETGSA